MADDLSRLIEIKHPLADIAAGLHGEHERVVVFERPDEDGCSAIVANQMRDRAGLALLGEIAAGAERDDLISANQFDALVSRVTVLAYLIGQREDRDRFA